MTDGCRRAGVFEYAAWRVATSRAGEKGLLAALFVAVSLATAALNLDAAVLVMTPVALGIAARRGFGHETYSVSTIHLANSASLLLPVSNLTNLMVFHETDLSFLAFTALMTLPWCGAILAEWVLVPRLSRPAPASKAPELPSERPEVRGAPVGILGATFLGFMISGPLGLDPIFFAWGGAVAMVLWEQSRRRGIAKVLSAARPVFLIGLLALGAFAWGLGEVGLTDIFRNLLPTGESLPTLLVIAFGSALLANLINNLPATLLLLPAVAAAGEGPLLAMLIGVGIGPNLSYPGSIANLLWRRVMIEDGAAVPWREFTRIGLVTVPIGITVATALLWVALQV